MTHFDDAESRHSRHDIALIAGVCAGLCAAIFVIIVVVAAVGAMVML